MLLIVVGGGDLAWAGRADLTATDLRMKLVSEYLEQAQHFEQLAATENHPNLKEQLLQQAAAYHRLAAKRAQELGGPIPQKRS